jgi:hypothetical protein
VPPVSVGVSVPSPGIEVAVKPGDALPVGVTSGVVVISSVGVGVNVGVPGVKSVGVPLSSGVSVGVTVGVRVLCCPGRRGGVIEIGVRKAGIADEILGISIPVTKRRASGRRRDVSTGISFGCGAENPRFVPWVLDTAYRDFADWPTAPCTIYTQR